MARSIHRLADRTVKTVGAGLHPDGGGLYLQVTEGTNANLTRSWLFRFATTESERAANGELGRERRMGLGSYPAVSLAEAREKAAAARKLRERGLDPIEARGAEAHKAAAATAKTIIFEKAAEQYIAAHEKGWRNDKHRAQWSSAIKTYANPVIGKLDVRDIDTSLVMQVLEPIWTTIPETAGRLRGRIERILGWAKVNGYRAGENPARWTDNLDQLLPARSKVRKVEPQPALPYEQIGAFMAELREQEGTAARALEFAILTAARSGEVRGMRWDGGELTGNLWTCPADRMKRRKTHRVPLAQPAVRLLDRMRENRRSNYAFPGNIKGEALSDMALTDVIRRMNNAREAAGLPRWMDPNQGGRDVVPHGFRSTFRDWVSEETNFPDYLAEAALAHAKGDKVEAAYKRGDVLAKRRHLIEAWAVYCASAPADNVTHFRQAS